MAKLRRRGKPWNPANPVHDRRATVLGKDAEVVFVEVDDPYEDGGKILAARSIRTDTLARMLSRRQIDSAMFEAGRAFQNDFETIQSRPHAVDASEPYVDRSFRHRGISDGYSKALARLNLANEKLGMIGSPIANAVLIDGKTMAQVASARGLLGKSWEEHYGKLFRECLDCLAVVYGYAMRRG